jgi:hypothetical protein
MRRNGDRKKPIWMTELGWSTGGPSFPFTMSERAQAKRLSSSLKRLVACRKRWGLRKVFWFAYADRPLAGESDYWGFHNGLRRVDGRAKPAYRAYSRLLSRPGKPRRRIRARCR